MGSMAESIRFIVHADMDAFYASVEQMDRPELRGRPVVVGGSPDQRGVVAACSYEAREYGIRSAMPMRTALRLCPDVIRVPPRFDRYGQVSEHVMAIFRSVTPLVQPLSLDEAFLDVSQVVESGVSPEEVARSLKIRVKEEVGLVVSVGVATSKSVAKIASDFDKPDGLVLVDPGTERAFLAPLPVKRLSGIGPSTEQRLAREGIATLGDLAGQTETWAGRLLGKRGPGLLAMSRGQDRHPVVTERVVKSVSAETTFSQDIHDPMEMGDRLARLCQRVARRLESSGVMGRTVTVKLRLADFTTFTRAVTLSSPANDTLAIQEAAQRLLDKELLPGRSFRLLGLGVSNFGQTHQLPLFDEASSRLGATAKGHNRGGTT